MIEPYVKITSVYPERFDIQHPKLPGGRLCIAPGETTQIHREVYHAVARSIAHKVTVDRGNGVSTPVAVVDEPVKLSPIDTIIESIARACHEANRAYCISIGDDSQPAWDDAPEWQKKSAIAGVRAILDNPGIGPEEMHGRWMALKVSEGWVYGEVKDVEAKTHPCILPYDELPDAQRVKDTIFRKTALQAIAPYRAPGSVDEMKMDEIRAAAKAIGVKINVGTNKADAYALVYGWCNVQQETKGDSDSNEN